MDTVKTMDIQSQKTKNKNMSTVQTESTHVLCLRGKKCFVCHGFGLGTFIVEKGD